MRLINPFLILRILSSILFIETLAFLSCLPVALIYDEPLLPFLWSSVITGSLYLILRISTSRVDILKISTRDGYLSVTLSWIIFAIMGTLPYLISRTIPSFINAFFESTSGFTTTGATIIRDVESLPYSILFWRSFTHWIGGLGIIVAVIIILPSLKISAQQLLSLESSMHEKIHPKTKSIVYRILFLYLGFTLAEIILLSLGDMNLFDSICHTFGTVATGGFSTRNTNIADYSAYTQYIIAFFMFLAGISFVVYYYILKRNFTKVKHNEELWFYTGTVIVAGIIASLILLTKTGKQPELAFREGFFQVISIITTTGFITTDYSLWPAAGALLIFVLLFAGACTGSTTGSIKMARHLLVIKNIKNVYNKLSHPNLFSQIRLNNKPIPEKINISTISFVLLYLFIFLIGTVLIVITGVDPVASAGAAASSLGNIGPGLGAITTIFNYSSLPESSKVILSLLMIVGRLEILTVFTLFTRSFWKL